MIKNTRLVVEALDYETGLRICIRSAFILYVINKAKTKYTMTAYLTFVQRSEYPALNQTEKFLIA